MDDYLNSPYTGKITDVEHSRTIKG